MMQKIQEAVAYIKNIINAEPVAGIVLGSGLGNFAEEIKVKHEIAYGDIPHFPVSTAGRFHFYEGFPIQDIVFPIRVMKFLGIKTLFLSNAAGGTNPSFKVGDLMIIKDHISFFTPNPLVGKNVDALGPRFPDMSEPYSLVLINKAKKIAAEANIDIKEGVYIAVTGPTFETKAEYKFVNIMGADAVGMSTVQENITAVHMGLPVFAVSVITDLGMMEGNHSITHQEVLEAAKAAEPRLTHIFKALIAQL